MMMTWCLGTPGHVFLAQLGATWRNKLELASPIAVSPASPGMETRQHSKMLGRAPLFDQA